MARDRKCFLFLALLFGAVVKATFRLLGGRRESVFFCWHRAGRRALESGKCKKHTNCLPILSFLCNFGRPNILKSRFMLKSIQHFAYIAALMAALALLASCTGGKKRYVIGVSQCSEDVWREKLNQELRVAALYYNNIDLDIASANDDVRLQTDQINRFVDKGVDLLIVAPGQVSISPAIDRAYEKGIPVIIFDRRTRSNKYTAYIGADNREIGASWENTWRVRCPKEDVWWSCVDSRLRRRR